MIESYCLRCKKHTPNLDEHIEITKNNREALKSICSICKSKKCQFIKSSKQGGELFAGEHHLRTIKGKPYNFCGPNTRTDLRLNEDDSPKDWSLPINKVDDVCLRHDIAYKDTSKAARHAADRKMVEELNNLKDLNFDEKAARLLVKPIIWGKEKLGLGLKKTRTKKPKNYTKK